MPFNRKQVTLASVLLLVLTCARSEDEHHKRVPSGFTGVRGKKSIPDEAYTADDVDNSLPSYNVPITENPIRVNYVVEKRAPSGFFGMRGKKPWTREDFSDDIYKRAPMGFFGMRGKKDNDEDEFQYDELSKRAQMGFFGMRGKKYSGPPGYQGDKRALMGFVGMRGKKDYENPTGYFEEKRAPSGFFGMRGKKRPSGFFGMRGKKYPYEFRGKFVGVRGKKSLKDFSPSSDYDLESNLDRIGQDLDMNQLMLLLTEQNRAQISDSNDLSDQ